jgi:hypothetical protein
VENPFLKDFFFDFDKKISGTTERGNDWNYTTSALFKNLVKSAVAAYGRLKLPRAAYGPKMRGTIGGM